MTAMALEWRSWRFTPAGDRRFYAYVLKHNGTPIWIGMGTGIRHEIWSHCTSTATPDAKRKYIVRHLGEITSEIVFPNLTWAKAAEESDLIEEFGLFNRTYGASCREQTAFGAIAETVAKCLAESAKRQRVLTLDEIAGRAATTRRNIERLNAAGEGPGLVQVSARKFGVIENDFEEWLRARRHPAPGKADEKEGPNV